MVAFGKRLHLSDGLLKEIDIVPRDFLTIGAAPREQIIAIHKQRDRIILWGIGAPPHVIIR
jgi:hypothetical protein